MEKIIIIKYGELSTKKDNINFFLNILKTNIKNSLKDECIINYDRGRMFITNINNYDKVINILKNTFGIHEINVGYKLNDNNLETIESDLKVLIEDKDFKTFKVETKRSYKKYKMNSMEISKYLGGVVLKFKNNIKVDVHNPEVVINVEVRSDHAFIYFDKENGLGGYPVGSLGKGLLMLSGGIDSPVAGFLVNATPVPEVSPILPKTID